MPKIWLRWLIVLGVVALFFLARIGTTHATSASVTVSVQVMDSCKEALPGANFTLITPNGTKINAGPSAGTKRVTVSSGSCPLQRGNCEAVPTGCVSWVITPPSSGVATYVIKERAKFDATDGFYENPPGPTAFSGFVPCNGGSACRYEHATFTIDTTGIVTGTTTNVYPDGTKTMYPAGGTFTGTKTDPIVFHNFQLGNGSCDGDSDQDDHLTGSPSSHCDSEQD